MSEKFDQSLARRTTRATLATRALIVVLALLITAVAGVQLYTTLAIRGAQKNNSSTLVLMKDCTTPGGKCYTRGQAQTAHAVGSINRVIVLASACAVGLDPKMPVPDRQAAIQSCVVDRLAAQTSP